MMKLVLSLLLLSVPLSNAAMAGTNAARLRRPLVRSFDGLTSGSPRIAPTLEEAVAQARQYRSRPILRQANMYIQSCLEGGAFDMEQSDHCMLSLLDDDLIGVEDVGAWGM